MGLELELATSAWEVSMSPRHPHSSALEQREYTIQKFYDTYN